MYVCTFCGIERDVVAKGPGICICDVCLAAIEAGERVAAGEGRCSFCNEAPRVSRFRLRQRALVLINARGDVRICSSCAPIARTALDHNRMLAAREEHV